MDESIQDRTGTTAGAWYRGENVHPWQTVRHRNGTIGPACTCGTHAPDPACIHPTHTTYRSWTPGDMAQARARLTGTAR